MSYSLNIKKYIDEIQEKNLIKYTGKITKVAGLTIESDGPIATIGELCYIYPYRRGEVILADLW